MRRVDRSLRAGLLLGLTVATFGCMRSRVLPDVPPVSQLTVRSIQSRFYDGPDVRTVMKTVMNVLQDDGFLVHYGDVDLGLLDASKSTATVEVRSFELPLGIVFGRPGVAELVVDRIRATANVSAFGDRIAVRVNFERERTDRHGRTTAVAEITDAKAYQEFFAMLDKGLFIQREGL